MNPALVRYNQPSEDKFSPSVLSVHLLTAQLSLGLFNTEQFVVHIAAVIQHRTLLGYLDIKY